MKRKDFMRAVKRELKGLPRDEIRNSLAFFDEAISDRMDGGMTEAQAVAALGTPNEAAAQLIAELPYDAEKISIGNRVCNALLLILALLGVLYCAVGFVMPLVTGTFLVCTGISLGVVFFVLEAIFTFEYNVWSTVCLGGCGLMCMGATLIAWPLWWRFIRVVGKGAIACGRSMEKCVRKILGIRRREA